MLLKYQPLSEGIPHMGRNNSIQLPANKLSLHNRKVEIIAAQMRKHVTLSLVDRIVARLCRKWTTNLCTTWTDYKKAYNSMPYT